MHYTPKQLRVMQFIRDFKTEHLVSPTLEELAEHMGVTKPTAFGHIEALIRKGALSKTRSEARSLEVLDEQFRHGARADRGAFQGGALHGGAFEKQADDERGVGLAAPLGGAGLGGDAATHAKGDVQGGSEGTPDGSKLGASTRPVYAIPLVGKIAAGQPIETIEEVEPLDFTEVFASRENCYALQVSGDSMIDDGIHDGDVVVVERRQTASNGETVVAVLPGEEATLKRFYRDGGRFRLQPANPRMDPIYVTELEIRGVVLSVHRKF